MHSAQQPALFSKPIAGRGWRIFRRRGILKKTTPKEPDSLNFLWKDRKRICGLPITFTRYSLSEDRLFLETGLLSLHQDEILLYRVRDISLHMTLGQRIFGVGSVLVLSSDKSLPELVLKNIKQPREVKELIHQQVEQAKDARRMRVGELLGDEDNPEADPADFEE